MAQLGKVLTMLALRKYDDVKEALVVTAALQLVNHLIGTKYGNEVQLLMSSDGIINRPTL